MKPVKLISLSGPTFGHQTHGHGKVSASEVLTSFCKWQRRLTQDEGSGSLLYDVALLVTRDRICQDPEKEPGGCEALGLAELGTVCSPSSCALVQDNGLSSAATIAHELGHV